MGIFVNPGNSGFSDIRNGRYVDKSGLIALVNQALGTPQKLVCVSRPRRFGKSFAAQMLCAYYDRSCDSSGLFSDLCIANDPETRESYLEHLNAYNVIYLDMTGVIGEAPDDDLVGFCRRRITAELRELHPELRSTESFATLLADAVERTGSKFVMIVDEWDAPIRELAGNVEVQRTYLEFLRSLFKNSGVTSKVFAGAYMTGILPVKKDGSQSAISEFQERSMLWPGEYAAYIGFTEAEVRELCGNDSADFDQMKRWYDGYVLERVGSVYNPNSVMEALRSGDYRSYWVQTSAADSLLDYVSLDFDGISKAMAKLLGGLAVPVDTNGFSNDMETFRDKDDILTLLIHLGYLTYDNASSCARIPNEELRLEFARTVRRDTREETVRRVRESDRLIEDTVAMDAKSVAERIEAVHSEECAPLFYNNEQSLRGVVKLAYFSYRDHYVKMEELPGGDGFADIVYLPKQGSPYPALVVELKCAGSAEGAIAQIRRKRYPSAIEGFGGDVLLVGISYDRDSRKHSCVIEPM